MLAFLETEASHTQYKVHLSKHKEALNVVSGSQSLPVWLDKRSKDAVSVVPLTTLGHSLSSNRQPFG